MPELPEVEVVRAGLEPAVTGALVQGVEIFDTRSLRRHDPIRGDFEAGLTGQRLTAAVRRGKFLWFPLATETPTALVGHLGMSGQMLLRAPGDATDRNLRVRLQLEHPEHGELWLHFVDQRIFGSLALDELVPTTDGERGGLGWDSPTVPRAVHHIARDPLDPAFADRDFFTRLGGSKSGIKRNLLDQRLISGIGNIYADEALWSAGIHYAHPSNALRPADAARLLAAVRSVLKRALAEGGTSFDAQYVNVNGQSGYFAHSLNAYGQQGKPCPRCGTTLVREAFMNRGSHHCPTCQQMPTPSHPGTPITRRATP